MPASCLLIRGRHQVAGAKLSAMARDKKRLSPSRIIRSARAVSLREKLTNYPKWHII